MEWTKVEIQTTAIGAELVTGVLISHDISGAEILNAQERVRHLAEVAHTWDYAEEGLLDAESTDVFVIFYATKDERGALALSEIKESIAGLKAGAEGLPLGALTIKTESANDKTWLDEWKKFFKPFKIGKIVIVPEWEERPPAGKDEIIFRIDPGSAFGTGQHQTTKLCISALQEHLRGGETVLDIGCGSGILSIISLLLGAGDVFACDIDPAGAIAATKKNAELNGLIFDDSVGFFIFPTLEEERFLEIRAGDALSCEELRDKICRNKYEVIVANIVADVVIELIPFVKELLTPEGVFIASGIIDERTDDVLRVFSQNKLQVVQKYEREGWFCIVGKR